MRHPAVWRLAVILSVSCGALSLHPGAAGAVEGFAAIQQAFLREEFPTVVTLAQDFLLQAPEAPEASRVWLWFVFSLHRLQRPQEALRQLDQLKRRLAPNDPLWVELWFWDGEISRQTYQMQRALQAYQMLLRKAPASSWAPQATIGLGLVYLYQESFEEARQRFHEVATQQAGRPVALDASLFEGLCLLRLKRFEEAVALLKPLVDRAEAAGALAQAAFYLGEAFTGLNRFQEAARAYERSIGSGATSQWSELARFGLGWASYQAGDCQTSIEAFERYLLEAVADHHTEALFAQGSCLLRLNRQEEAVNRLEQIVSRDPEHPLALESGLVVADAYRRQGRLPLAQGILHALLRPGLTEAQRARLQLRLAQIALEQDNVPKARTIFELARSIEDPVVRQEALMGLGDVQVFLGDLAEARRFYEEAARLLDGTPQSSWSWYQVGRIQVQLGQLDEAIALFTRLAKTDDPNLFDEVRLALAITHLTRRDETQARAYLDAIQRDRANQAIAHRVDYYLALLAMRVDDTERAEALCRSVMMNAPSTEEAVDARLLLADLMANERSSRDAVAWLEQAYASKGMPLRQRAKVAKHLGDLKRFDHACPEATRWYERAQELWPALAGEANYRIASCFEEAEDLDAALARYRVIRQMPWRVRGQLAAAKLLERLGHPREAQAIYESLADEPIPEARSIREHLASLRRDMEDDAN